MSKTSKGRVDRQMQRQRTNRDKMHLLEFCGELWWDVSVDNVDNIMGKCGYL